MTTQPDTHTDPETKSSSHQPDLAQNRSLWDKLQYTEKNFTKPVEGKGRPMTDINPTWRMKRMTEMFGPVGLGWGWTIEDRWIEEVGPKKYAYIQLTLWYSLDGGVTRLIAGPHIGGTDMGQGKDEAYKQSVTDAFGKCASMIGVSADIYMGKWDDSKYQNEASAAVEAQRNPDLQAPAIAKSEADLEKKLAEITDLKSLDDLWTGGINARVKEIGTVDDKARQRMISAFTQKKNELLALQNDKQKEPPPEDAPEGQPTIQEEADQDQEDHTREINREEAAAIAAQVANKAKEELTPGKIKQFEEWVSRKLTGVNDARELNALWERDCTSRMRLLKDVDETAHKRINAAYVKRLKEINPNIKTLDSKSR
jgi:hypothetical protein